MKKITLLFSLILFSHCALAKPLNLSNYFSRKSGCFLLFNVNQEKLVMRYNSARCAERISPDSTFKIALSLMAFDQHLITQKTVFKWGGIHRELPAWNQDQTPHTWLKYSVVWVSRVITPQLGMKRIKQYLAEFHYGNQDFSGDPRKNNGLTNAWLSSSLKISANEQLIFLNKLLLKQLPVSEQAIKNTESNMYLETTPQGWKLYGKTGAGSPEHVFLNNKHVIQDGWFIGYIQKSKQKYIFITNFTDRQKPGTLVSAGLRAKEITKRILTKLDLF